MHSLLHIRPDSNMWVLVQGCGNTQTVRFCPKKVLHICRMIYRYSEKAEQKIEKFQLDDVIGNSVTTNFDGLLNRNYCIFDF